MLLLIRDMLEVLTLQSGFFFQINKCHDIAEILLKITLSSYNLEAVGGHGYMEVGFITTYAISTNHH
jgi:hypothetical protein